ncbi:MAG: DNA repair protein RadA [Clostridia bacterium]|nr:DNA repair protein RadA [Clostridia bacterium]MBO7217007.1 DNA repair protein RadA [Clostridia bacterium]MBO7738600.1 DNA repair protein RadA [Clostridia bacterium]
MKTNYVCTSCGYYSSKWYGKCPECNEWNTFEEQAVESTVASKTTVKRRKTYDTPPSASKAKRISEIGISADRRFITGIGEFDRVLGGGLVKGSVVLLSGEPGIGKSTLLLQLCQTVGTNGSILYVSGEESPSQIKIRAERVGVDTENLKVLCETNISSVIPEMVGIQPDIVIIDSIQTMYDEDVASSPGSVTQVKQTALALINKAKEENISIILVGHVNKDGAIAGPKVLEHMVDAVLYFEGDRQHAYRIIRAAKNRYGSTNEIGVFEMVDDGLAEVENPSEMLMSQRPVNVPGSCAVCVVEGTRPIITEIQALATQTVYPSPRRLSAGLDYNRVALVLAVLEKRIGLRFSTTDVYMNVAGGLRLDDPSCDAAIAMALISTQKDIPIPEDLIVFGEIGLAGECRSVTGVEQRINEAERLGFKRIGLPKKSIDKLKKRSREIELCPIRSVYDLLKLAEN